MIRALEQISQRIAGFPGQATLQCVPGAIVHKKAALAEGTQVAQPVVARIMVKMCSGERHPDPFAMRTRRPLVRQPVQIIRLESSYEV